MFRKRSCCSVSYTNKPSTVTIYEVYMQGSFRPPSRHGLHSAPPNLRLDLGLGPSITSQLRAPKHAHRPEALHPGWAHRLAAVAEVMGRVPSLVGWREMVLYVVYRIR